MDHLPQTLGVCSECGGFVRNNTPYKQLDYNIFYHFHCWEKLINPFGLKKGGDQNLATPPKS